MIFLYGLIIMFYFVHLSAADDEEGSIGDTVYRIHGGRKSRAWSWLVSLTKKTLRNRPFCGGVLIHEQWVLTAGHCVNGTKNNDWIPKLGDYNIAIRDKGELTVKISKIFVHQNYEKKHYKNDIALLKLSKPVKLNNIYQAAILAEKKTSYEKGVCYIAGWGRTNEDLKNTTVLQEALVSIRDQKNCKRNYASKRKVITDDMLCAGNGEKGSCKGDAGTPLVCINKNQWHVVGISSKGNTYCSSRKFPSVYTRITSYHKWIHKIMKS